MDDRRLRDWDVLCAACGLQVGQLVHGRFIHHDDCPNVSRIGAGALRCCACGSGVTARERPAAEAAPIIEVSPISEAPVAPADVPRLAPVTRFAARRVSARGGRARR